MLKVNISGTATLSGREITDLVRKTLSSFGANSGEVEISFVQPDEIRRFNKKYRQIDQATDVLSFPQAKLPAGKEPLWGNIIIAQEVAAQKGEKLDEVIKHGLLHLLGFDHEEKPVEWERAAKIIGCSL